MTTPVHYLPIVTTALSLVFLAILSQAIRTRNSGPHLYWWAFGVFAYGLGTAIESTVTLLGNTPSLNKAWYVAGALWGGYPLAQGSAYLLLSRKNANVLTVLSLPFVVILSAVVFASPVDLSALEAHRPTGAVIAWKWLRLCTPIINLYAATFLVGGAFWSAFKYRNDQTNRSRVGGNIVIALGGILPGIGGAMAKGGIVEALYIGELVGLILMWIGYAWIARRHRPIERALSAAS